jgi:hypothetical protein
LFRFALLAELRNLTAHQSDDEEEGEDDEGAEEEKEEEEEEEEEGEEEEEEEEDTDKGYQEDENGVSDSNSAQHKDAMDLA